MQQEGINLRDGFSVRVILLVEIVSFVEVNHLLIAARGNKPARLFFLESYNVSCMSIGDYNQRNSCEGAAKNGTRELLGAC